MADTKKIEELLTRGVENIYPKREFVDSKLKKGKVTVYLGIDPTGPHLHLGHAIQLIKLKQFQDLGHKVILLMGDFTAMIGDPTDKTSVRKQLTFDEVKENLKNYKKQAEKILEFGGKNPVLIKFNNDWLGPLTFKEIIELTSHFTVQQMLARETFRKRFFGEFWCKDCKQYSLMNSRIHSSAPTSKDASEGTFVANIDKYQTCAKCMKSVDIEDLRRYDNLNGFRTVIMPQPIYLHEFLYPLMQGYDSVAMNVDGEVGGNDQTFNMLIGRDLLKMMKGKEKFVITTKLLADPSGVKMGKTTNNMIKLDDTAKEIYGKVMSWTDGMIVPGFELCTLVSMDDVKSIDIEIKRGVANPMEYKMRLAREIVTLYHDDTAALQAEQDFKNVFQEDEMPADMPEFSVTSKGKVKLLDLLFDSKLCASKGEARRMIEQGGVRVAGQKIEDINTEITPTSGTVIQVGKRKFIKLS